MIQIQMFETLENLNFEFVSNLAPIVIGVELRISCPINIYFLKN
jgi:hypothetical protein